MNPSTNTAEVVRRRLGIRDLEARFHVERSTVRRWYSTGNFPRPHFLGSRRMWWEDEIAAWEQVEMGRPARPCNLPVKP